MTRFARAHGSKASNERVPERSTPWNVMKKQLHQAQTQGEDQLERAKFEAIRKENYENFLKEQAAENFKESWCDFNDENSQIKKFSSSNSEKDTKIKANKKCKGSKITVKETSKNVTKNSDDENIDNIVDENIDDSDDENIDNSDSADCDEDEISKWLDEHSDNDMDEEYSKITSQLDSILQSKKKGKKKENVGNTIKKGKGKNEPDSSNSEFVESIQVQKKSKKNKLLGANEKNDQNNEEDVPKKKSKKRKNDISLIDTEDNEDVNFNAKSSKKAKVAENSVESSSNTKESKKKKNKRSLQDEENIVSTKLDIDPSTNVEETPKIKSSKKEKKKLLKASKINSNLNESNKDYSEIKKKAETSKNLSISNNATKTKDKTNNPEFKRRKEQSTQNSILIVNGEQLEVSNYDGFPILTKDAERLQQLRKSLISKGIQKSEVNRTLKLERRKAEKALSRMKKKLCFHCRKGGHNLSECPELSKQDNNTRLPSSGICFKCGSTEHTHFACKVIRTQDFKFAQCFICKEQGHISRQCPDNPRGLYPKGGGCRECGDVTHLKKDCPKIVQQKEDKSIKLDLLDSTNIEDVVKNPVSSSNNSSVKRIKF